MVGRKVSAWLILLCTGLLYACSSFPTYDGYKRIQAGFDVEITVEGSSGASMDALADKLGKHSFISKITVDKTTGRVVATVKKADDIYRIPDALALMDKIQVGGTLKSKYELSGAFTEYSFAFVSGVDTTAKYVVEVLFDPFSQVTIGGLDAVTSSRGQYAFYGVRIDLSDFSAGRVWIVDSSGAKVLLTKSNGAWSVKASGYSSGILIEKEIVIEAIK